MTTIITMKPPGGTLGQDRRWTSHNNHASPLYLKKCEGREIRAPGNVLGATSEVLYPEDSAMMKTSVDAIWPLLRRPASPLRCHHADTSLQVCRNAGLKVEYSSIM